MVIIVNRYAKKISKQRGFHMKQFIRVIPPFIAFLLLGTSSALVADEKTIEQGAIIYAQNCVFCHQADAIGKPGFAPSLSNPEFLSVASDKFILGTIRDGRQGTGMPPFAHLGRDQGLAIVAYLRSFSNLPHRAAEIDAQPTATGDTVQGKQLFDDICSTCHGQNGDGYVAGGTGTAIGKAGTLNKISDGFLRTTIKEGRSNTRMRGFTGAEGLANLSDQEIDDIIVYLRMLAK
jgi:cytochrome c oxidase cbb3-type subunit 3